MVVGLSGGGAVPRQYHSGVHHQIEDGILSLIPGHQRVLLKDGVNLFVGVTGGGGGDAGVGCFAQAGSHWVGYWQVAHPCLLLSRLAGTATQQAAMPA